MKYSILALCLLLAFGSDGQIKHYNKKYIDTAQCWGWPAGTYDWKTGKYIDSIDKYGTYWKHNRKYLPLGYYSDTVYSQDDNCKRNHVWNIEYSVFYNRHKIFYTLFIADRKYIMDAYYDSVLWH